MTAPLFEWAPPAWMPAEAWAAYVDLRRAKHKRAPFTELARQRIVEKLHTWHETGMDIEAVLWNSVESGWTGVFPTKARRVISNESSTADAMRLLGIDDEEVIDAEVGLQSVRRAA